MDKNVLFYKTIRVFADTRNDLIFMPRNLIPLEKSNSPKKIITSDI